MLNDACPLGPTRSAHVAVVSNVSGHRAKGMGFLMVDGALRLNRLPLAWKQEIADSVIPSFHNPYTR
jgi:hypothetical protein